ERRTLRDPSVYRIIAVSQYVAAQLAHYDVPPERIEIIPNAAAMPVLSPPQRDSARRAIREALAIPESTPAYLFVAQNPRLKGIQTLLGALQLFKADHIDAVALL